MKGQGMFPRCTLGKQVAHCFSDQVRQAFLFYVAFQRDFR